MFYLSLLSYNVYSPSSYFRKLLKLISILSFYLFFFISAYPSSNLFTVLPFLPLLFLPNKFLPSGYTTDISSSPSSIMLIPSLKSTKREIFNTLFELTFIMIWLYLGLLMADRTLVEVDLCSLMVRFFLS